jgi:hypothetical protein
LFPQAPHRSAIPEGFRLRQELVYTELHSYMEPAKFLSSFHKVYSVYRRTQYPKMQRCRDHFHIEILQECIKWPLEYQSGPPRTKMNYLDRRLSHHNEEAGRLVYKQMISFKDEGRTFSAIQVNGGSQSFNTVTAMKILGRWMRIFVIPNQSSQPWHTMHLRARDAGWEYDNDFRSPIGKDENQSSNRPVFGPFAAFGLRRINYFCRSFDFFPF